LKLKNWPQASLHYTVCQPTVQKINKNKGQSVQYLFGDRDSPTSSANKTDNRNKAREQSPIVQCPKLYGVLHLDRTFWHQTRGKFAPFRDNRGQGGKKIEDSDDKKMDEVHFLYRSSFGGDEYLDGYFATFILHSFNGLQQQEFTICLRQHGKAFKRKKNRNFFFALF
jgi:hypothetical protein